MRLAVGLQNAGARFFHSSIAGRLFTNAWYSLVCKLDKNAEATVMNYGYADLEGDRLELEPHLEVDRFAIALYHHVASSVPIREKDVLEIGCGRGGGAAYVAGNLHPRRFVGLDLNENAIAFDQDYYKTQNNLQFIAGDAHALPFGENTFDVALNVESSHHYQNFGRFLSEVHRVLKPGGFFLMACFPGENEPSVLRATLNESRFECRLEQDITANVLRALELDSARREEAVLRLCPAPLRTFGREFAGLVGSKLYDSFASGKRQYLNFVLQKLA